MIEIAVTKWLHGAAGRIELNVRTELTSGSFVTLFGPSGVGKTTVLRILAGITKPDRGRVVIDGNVWFDSEQRINLPPQKRATGFVFQDYALFPNLSVRENVGYAVHTSDAAWIDELLELTGLSALAARLPGTLSGGQKQRVALARAIARKPRLLLLDEPLSALDASLRHQLQDDLLRLHQRFKLSTILVTHDLSEVFKLSQRVLRMDNGRIVQSGDPAEVFLQQRTAGNLHLHAEVLDIRREDVVYVLSLLVGRDIVDIIASEDEAADLRQGDTVLLSTKALSPLLFKKQAIKSAIP